jgi:hypothetical protein
VAKNAKSTKKRPIESILTGDGVKILAKGTNGKTSIIIATNCHYSKRSPESHGVGASGL